MIPVARCESHGDQVGGASVTTEHPSKVARGSKDDKFLILGPVCVDSLRDAAAGVV